MKIKSTAFSIDFVEIQNTSSRKSICLIVRAGVYGAKSSVCLNLAEQVKLRDCLNESILLAEIE